MSLSVVFVLINMAAGEVVSPVKSDEVVIFFPTAARLAEDGTEWLVPIHGWIFEPEQHDFLRERSMRGLLSGLDLDRSGPRGQLLAQRLRWFLVDNERGKELVIRIGQRTATLQPSEPNGHFRDTLRIAREEAEQFAESGWLRFQVVLPEGDDREFGGALLLVSPRGVSVISDIDDTIKITEVRHKHKVMENTFLEPFRVVEGMAPAFQQWARRGAALHYVSNGPWQLYPPLASFLQEAGYPSGTVHLRDFRVQDGEFLKFLLTDPRQAKLPRIEQLLAEFPERRFVLVGDSGEKDPETYGEIARRRPEQILHIFLRDVTDEPRASPRYTDAFRNVALDKWSLFTDPATLPALPGRQ